MSKKIYLSPSTQEKNIGKGNYKSEEYRMNQVCDITEKELKRHGVTVYRNKPTMTLREVVKDSNKKRPDIHFALHSNAGGGGRGMEIFCHKFGGEGEKLARAVYSKVEPLTPTPDRGVKKGHNFYGTGKSMYELAYTTAPAALIEIAFHDSVPDAAWIVANIETIGIAIAKGILSYFGITYKAPVNPKVFYRVMAGSYATRENAENQVKRLKKAGFDSAIMVFKPWLLSPKER